MTLSKAIEKAIHDFSLACESVGVVNSDSRPKAIYAGVYRYRGETYKALQEAIAAELEVKK